MDHVFPGQKGRVQIKSDITDAQVKVKLHIFFKTFLKHDKRSYNKEADIPNLTHHY